MGNLIAIGDIHGCFKTMRTLLEEKVQPGKEDTLIFLGDYVDRGPDSKSVIDYIIGLGNTGHKTVLLRGNHEQTMIDALETENSLRKGWFSKPKNAVYESWFEKFGGRETLQSYGIDRDIKQLPENHRQWLQALKFYHKTEDHLFVHAGFNFSNADIFEDADAMLWTREFDYDAKKAGGRKVVHGHVPVQLDFLQECLQRPQLGFVPLDTGCVYKERPGMGYLSAFDFTQNKLHYQKNVEPR